MVAAGAGALAALPDQITALLADQPLLVAAVVAVVVVALVLVGLVAFRRLRRRPVDRFLSAVGSRDEIVVMMHPNPDPDAMASALAVAHLAEEVETETTLQHAGQVRHQENRAFETVLGLDIQRIEDTNDLACHDVVLVDHNEARGFAGAGGVSPLAVVDHHPGDGRGTSFTDVRDDYGACATIFAEYLQHRGWTTGDADDERTLDSSLATALMSGILSDTKDLTRGCSDAEFEAASYLYPAIDGDALDRIANPQVDAEVLDVKARAIANRVTNSPYAFTDVGSVSNVDAIAQAADELLRLEGITAVVVCGEKGGTVHLSGRSRDDRVHMGKALRNATDDIPMAEAGGHARMGGGQLSLDHMEGLGPGEGVSRDQLRERVFAAMTGEV